METSDNRASEGVLNKIISYRYIESDREVADVISAPIGHFAEQTARAAIVLPVGTTTFKGRVALKNPSTIF